MHAVCDGELKQGEERDCHQHSSTRVLVWEISASISVAYCEIDTLFPVIDSERSINLSQRFWYILFPKAILHYEHIKNNKVSIAKTIVATGTFRCRPSDVLFRPSFPWLVGLQSMEPAKISSGTRITALPPLE